MSMWRGEKANSLLGTGFCIALALGLTFSFRHREIACPTMGKLHPVGEYVRPDTMSGQPSLRDKKTASLLWQIHAMQQIVKAPVAA
jgi:hypothetical protein